MAQETTYQPELDGLRALAVTAVLLCHLDFPWMPGGFVGVDIFFVLSGYLITRLIATEIARTGKFSFGNFYVRRIRRLYPALVTTVLVTWVGAFLLFSPWQMHDFANSAIASLLSFANVLFYFESGYFDALAATKPLLHTWSLSVEEQFYLLWPPLLLVLSRFLRGRAMLVAVVAVAVAGFAVGLYLLKVDSSAAFYLLPARVAELGIGAMLVWLPPLKNRWLLNVASLLGLAAMAVAMLYYHQSMPFPGAEALLPCLGAALFIAGSQSDVAIPFRLSPVVWLGRISYSLYLVHWPVIVLWRAYFYQPLEGLVPWLLMAASVALAWLQYFFIEQRFRRPVVGRNWRVIAGLATIATIVIGVSAYAAIDHGWRWRVPDARLEAASKASHVKRCGPTNPALDASLFTCQAFRDKDKDLFVWGDSHALHLASGLADTYPDYNIYILNLAGCVPQSGIGSYLRAGDANDGCAERNRKALAFFTEGPPRNIILTSAKRDTADIVARATTPILEALRKNGNTVAFLGDFIRPGVDLISCNAVPDYLLAHDWVRQRCMGVASEARRELAFNKRMKKLIPEFISPSSIQCPKGVCRFYDKGRLLYKDDHHLNDRGSKLFVPRLKRRLPFD